MQDSYASWRAPPAKSLRVSPIPPAVEELTPGKIPNEWGMDLGCLASALMFVLRHRKCLPVVFPGYMLFDGMNNIPTLDVETRC